MEKDRPMRSPDIVYGSQHQRIGTRRKARTDSMRSAPASAATTADSWLKHAISSRGLLRGSETDILDLFWI